MERDRVGKDRAWRQVRADWRDVVLVCRKCSRKLDGGFGRHGEETLAKALRKSLARAGEDATRKVKTRRRTHAVVEVGCLDVCPKGAVLAMRGRDPGRWHLVPRGADLRDVMQRLGLHEDAPGSVGRAALGDAPADRDGAVPPHR